MVKIYCKACKRFKLEVTEEMTGKILVVCRRPSCKRRFAVTLPLREQRADSQEVVCDEREDTGSEAVN